MCTAEQDCVQYRYREMRAGWGTGHHTGQETLPGFSKYSANMLVIFWFFLNYKLVNFSLKYLFFVFGGVRGLWINFSGLGILYYQENSLSHSKKICRYIHGNQKLISSVVSEIYNKRSVRYIFFWIRCTSRFIAKPKIIKNNLRGCFLLFLFLTLRGKANLYLT